MILVMPRILAIAGMVVAGLMLLIFGLDIAVGLPFGRADSTIDIGFIVSSLILAYLSWSAFRDVR